MLGAERPSEPDRGLEEPGADLLAPRRPGRESDVGMEAPLAQVPVEAGPGPRLLGDPGELLQVLIDPAEGDPHVLPDPRAEGAIEGLAAGPP